MIKSRENIPGFRLLLSCDSMNLKLFHQNAAGTLFPKCKFETLV